MGRDRAEDALTKGIQLFDTGEYGPALALLQEIADESPKRPEALLYIGRIYLAADQPSLAEQCFRTASLHIAEAYVFYLLGEALLDQGMVVPAEAAFREALRREPGSTSALLMLGRAVMGQDRLGEAIRCFERAILHDGRMAAARYYLTEALVKKGDMVRAVGQLHYLLQLEPKYVPAIVLKGDIAFKMKDYRQAAAEYSRAAEMDEVEAAVMERLGHAYLAIGDDVRALHAYDAATRLDATHWAAFVWAGRIAQERKLHRRALGYFRAIAGNPEFGAEAAEAVLRLEAYFARFDLSEPAASAQSEEEPLEAPTTQVPLARPALPPPPSMAKITTSFNVREGVSFPTGSTRALAPREPLLAFDDDEDESGPLLAGMTGGLADVLSASKNLTQKGLSVLKDFIRQVQREGS